MYIYTTHACTVDTCVRLGLRAPRGPGGLLSFVRTVRVKEERRYGAAARVRLLNERGGREGSRIVLRIPGPGGLTRSHGR